LVLLSVCLDEICLAGARYCTNKRRKPKKLTAELPAITSAP
jgi:hypothetical protein